MMKERASGLLLHITSLPTKYGIGDFGLQAYRFADFLKEARQKYWQVLPLNPITTESHNSPYSCLSAFAGNWLLISPELLCRRGLLKSKEITDKPNFSRLKVDYRSVISYKSKLLCMAFRRFQDLPKPPEFKQFCSKNKNWLDDYAVFTALRQHFGSRLWCDWPKKLRDADKQTLKSITVPGTPYGNKLREKKERAKFLQYMFFEQWFALKKYCNKIGIRIIGDVPFYPAYESSDVWANPEFFKLTKSKKVKAVSGVPPDLFSSTGQLWNNPIYDWSTLKNKGYRWWINRIKHNLELFDVIRLDHFRGFVAHWQVPSGSKTAINGKWVDGPKDDFFRKLFKEVPRRSIIAEDLGYITADVRDCINRNELTGMRVLLFAFGSEFPQSPHCPGNHIKDCVVYTGTHDNNTVRGWFENQAKVKDKKHLFKELGRKVPPSRIHSEFIRLAMSSVANLIIIPVQDVLGLGAIARMNHPAKKRGNWRWRLRPGRLTKKCAGKLAKLTLTFARG